MQVWERRTAFEAYVCCAKKTYSKVPEHGVCSAVRRPPRRCLPLHFPLIPVLSVRKRVKLLQIVSTTSQVFVLCLRLLSKLLPARLSRKAERRYNRYNVATWLVLKVREDHSAAAHTTRAYPDGPLDAVNAEGSPLGHSAPDRKSQLC